MLVQHTFGVFGIVSQQSELCVFRCVALTAHFFIIKGAMLMNENKTGAGSVIAVIIVIVLIIAMIGSCSGNDESSSHSSETCVGCGRTWQAGDPGGNFMSIVTTGMCKNCYNNFKWAQNALGNYD